MTAERRITVTLGEEQRLLDEQLASGDYADASEVLRAGLLALEREDWPLGEEMRAGIQDALDDQSPVLKATDVFSRLEERHAERMKASGRGA
ncbi:type II toxin-antitoxin system ParD family antitoxin [Jiella sp. M17.18]|uniref:ribbon-helix-helix domain-containing protein n=1 Tax=Jiella sp. M17.18 TaxID=3234247 RepID=UPI0034DFDB14